ncbi:calcium-binding protein [Burkholderia ubonensis]|uniref:calcium-binding protein n=1 Tax=Burkholderia ubonensis TaxID=101571 RepID=UPI0007C658B0|nr:calcium-binding protein [Burkholderia ubonensis]
MEIVVDTYTEEECATVWYCHLDSELSFPFKARVRQAMEASPLKTGEIVTVVALAHEQLCRAAIFVQAKHGDRDIVAPLAQLVPVGGSPNAREAVFDWHYWHDHGYSF